MRTLFTSESVTEGHPDKICDQISDAVLDAILAEDPEAHVACETCTTTGLVMVMGEVATKANISVDRIVRQTICDIGYDRAKYGFDGNTCAVITALHEQSPDIAQGVNAALESREEEKKDIGAGDQGMMFGYACNETPELMPMPIALAHRITRRLSQARRSGELPWLRPDGKSQVTVEYDGHKPVRVDTVVVSTQHAPEIACQPDGALHHRRPHGGFRPDGQKDHRRYVRRIRAPRRRRLQREGSHEGGPQCGICRAVCGQEHRCSRPGGPL